MKLFTRIRKGASPSSSTILFLHGFMGDSRDFEPFAEIVNRRGYKTISIDMPGHGESPIGEWDSFEGFCGELWQSIASELSGAVAIVSYSQGARVALVLKKLYGDEISHLLVESGALGIQDKLERDDRFRIDQTLLNPVIEGGKPFGRFLDAWYALPLFKGIKTSRSYDAMLKRRLEQDPTKLQQSLRVFSVGNMSPLHEDVGSFTGRNLFVSGTDDKKYDEIGKTLPSQWNTISVPSVGHNVHLQNPEAYINLLEDFLSDFPYTLGT